LCTIGAPHGHFGDHAEPARLAHDRAQRGQNLTSAETARCGAAVGAGRNVSARRSGIGIALMDRVLSSAWRDGTYGSLNRALTILREGDVPSRAALAELEMPRLIDALLALLADHEPDEDGRCRRCSRWRRRRGIRCSVWVTAHRHLVGTNDVSGKRGGRHVLSVGRGSVCDERARS
jgi:hypothetical protein